MKTEDQELRERVLGRIDRLAKLTSSLPDQPSATLESSGPVASARRRAAGPEERGLKPRGRGMRRKRV